MMDPVAGQYPAQILKIEPIKNGQSFSVFFEIAVGASAGYATMRYISSGYWPLTFSLVKDELPNLIRIVNQGSFEIIDDLYDWEALVGHNVLICLDVNQTVTHILSASAYNVTSEDIHIQTDGAWRQGSEAQHHALMLARYSGLPVIYADFSMSRSLMVDWCADHQVILVPQKLHYGDFAAPDSQVAVILIDSLEDLARNFGGQKSFVRQAEATQKAYIEGDKLIYIVGTSLEDQVYTLDDLANWSGNIRVRGEDRKIISVTGKMLRERLEQYLRRWPNTQIIFADQDKIRESIFESLGASAIL